MPAMAGTLGMPAAASRASMIFGVPAPSGRLPRAALNICTTINGGVYLDSG